MNTTRSTIIASVCTVMGVFLQNIAHESYHLLLVLAWVELREVLSQGLK